MYIYTHECMYGMKVPYKLKSAQPTVLRSQ